MKSNIFSTKAIEYKKYLEKSVYEIFKEISVKFCGKSYGSLC